MVSDRPGGVRIRVHAQPGAARSEVVGMHGDRLKLRVQSPPVDGRANQAIEQLLSGLLSVPRRQVRVVAGGSARQKVVEVDGIDAATARRLLLG